MNRGSFIQEVSDVYTSPFLDTHELKMALRAQKVSLALEKRALGLALIKRLTSTWKWAVRVEGRNESREIISPAFSRGRYVVSRAFSLYKETFTAKSEP